MEAASPRLRPRQVDVLLAAAVGAVGLFGLLGPVWLTAADAARVRPVTVALVLAQAAALWWRRRFPLAVLAGTLAALLTAEAVGDENAASLFGAHAAAYTAGTLARRDQLAVGVMAAGALGEALVRQFTAAATPAVVLLGPTGVLLALSWGAGRYVRVRRAYVAALVAYASRLEADRDERARQAVVGERRRIARELHDQVAHHLGVVALQTGAARRWLARDRERASAAMLSAEDAVRGALTTMPAILRALRAEAGDEPVPQPGVDDLPGLVERVSAAGPLVRLSVSGARRPLDPAVESTAYRIVQEALTNTLKHAGAAHAEVRMSFGDESLCVEVHDDGRGLAALRTSGGFGLLGMRERVELLGGGLETGVRVDGGFTVRATLPLSRGTGGPA